MTSPYLQRRLRSQEEVRSLRVHVHSVAETTADGDAPIPQEKAEAATPESSKRRPGLRIAALCALCLLLLVLAYGWLQLDPKFAAIDIDGEAEMLNGLAPAAGPPEDPPADSFTAPAAIGSFGQGGTLQDVTPAPRFR